MTTDGKARFCALDPYTGARLAVIEAARNLACVGAVPKALVNCLNFGNPEHPEVMWQFSEVVDGMSDACRALGVPVVGGNVSFYNESRGRDIDPTPVVGVVGLLDELTSVPPAPQLRADDAIVLFGHTEAELGGSEWAGYHDLRNGMPPSADLDVAAALHDFVRALVVAREVNGVHDVSDGGLAVTLAEMAVAGACGFDVALGSELDSCVGVVLRDRVARRRLGRPGPRRRDGRAAPAPPTSPPSASVPPAAIASSPRGPSPSPWPMPPTPGATPSPTSCNEHLRVDVRI